MAETARVSSFEAIESFRIRLLVYSSKAKPLIDDARDEVARTRDWLRSDRRVHWENELRKRKRQLEQAEQAHFSARFSSLREVTTAEQAAVQRAKRAVAEAEEKIRLVKYWSARFDDQTSPLLKQLEQLRGVVAGDLAKGAAQLARILEILERYAEARPAAVGPRAKPEQKEEIA